jgi:hypothetical protein
MEIKEMIETLIYKGTNIKAKIEPDFFFEVAERLEKQVAKELHIYANGTEHCPSCDANLTGMGFKYCVECGQALNL